MSGVRNPRVGSTTRYPQHGDYGLSVRAGVRWGPGCPARPTTAPYGPGITRPVPGTTPGPIGHGRAAWVILRAGCRDTRTPDFGAVSGGFGGYGTGAPNRVKPLVFKVFHDVLGKRWGR